MNAERFPLSRILMIVAFVAAMGGYTACGGGGGGDGSNDSAQPDLVAIGGTVSDTESGRIGARALSDITVCALGMCDTTDASGRWGLTVSGDNYLGGDISFQFSGDGLAASTIVPALASGARDIQIAFLAQDNSTVSVASIVEDGVPRELGGDSGGGSGEEPLSTDPRERACQILERSNISIPNVSTPIVQHDDSDCPLNINALIVVGNQRPIPYDYDVTVDFKDAVLVDPDSGTAGQGVLNIHNAQYLCNRNQDFVATVTARVTRYYPPDGSEPITAEDAIALCGSGAAIGNTSESVQITFDVLEQGGSSSSGSSTSTKGTM